MSIAIGNCDNDPEKLSKKLTQFAMLYDEEMESRSIKYHIPISYSNLSITPLGKSIPRGGKIFKGRYISPWEQIKEYEYYRIEPSTDGNVPKQFKIYFTPFIIEGKYLDILVRE